LTPTTEDIYFLTSLSIWGEPVNLRTFPQRPHNIEDYIGMYCEDGTEKVRSQVSIHNIASLNLWIVLYMIGWITRSVALHQASCAHMHCATQFLHAMIFYQSTMMLTCMKKQLIDYMKIRTKKFGFGTVLYALLFERVSSLSPQEIV